MVRYGNTMVGNLREIALHSAKALVDFHSFTLLCWKPAGHGVWQAEGKQRMIAGLIHPLFRGMEIFRILLHAAKTRTGWDHPASEFHPIGDLPVFGGRQATPKLNDL